MSGSSVNARLCSSCSVFLCTNVWCLFLKSSIHILPFLVISDGILSSSQFLRWCCAAIHLPETHTQCFILKKKFHIGQLGGVLEKDFGFCCMKRYVLIWDCLSIRNEEEILSLGLDGLRIIRNWGCDHPLHITVDALSDRLVPWSPDWWDLNVFPSFNTISAICFSQNENNWVFRLRNDWHSCSVLVLNPRVKPVFQSLMMCDQILYYPSL